MEDKKFWHELKALVGFLASGAFAAVHKEFMDPKELFPDGHLAIKIHNWGHFGIGVFLQLLIFACLVWVAQHIWYMFKERKPSENEEIKLKNETLQLENENLKLQLELQQQDQQSSPTDKK